MLGGAFGAVLLAAGLGRAVLAMALGASVSVIDRRDLLWAGLYVAGFALAGGAAGALWPLRRRWWGALLVGYIWAAIVGAACGVIGMQMDGSRDMTVYGIFVAGVTVIFGTLAAYQFRKA